jgi:hypothetical protein
MVRFQRSSFGFIVKKVEMEKIFPGVLGSYTVNIIPSMLHIDPSFTDTM